MNDLAFLAFQAFQTPSYSMHECNGSDFRSELFEHLSKQLNIDRKFTTSYHAGCNGAVERYNKTLKTALRAISIDKGLDFSKGNGWDMYIPYINSITNSRKTRRTNHKLSPSEMFIGRSPRTPIDFCLDNIEAVKRRAGGPRYFGWIADQIKINQAIASDLLDKYDAKRKAEYDKNRTENKFKPGDVIKAWKGKYPASGSSKLKVNWTGPFRITEQFNDGKNFRVQSILKPSVYDVFNVTRIAHYKQSEEQLADSMHVAPIPNEEELGDAISNQSLFGRLWAEWWDFILWRRRW